MKKAYPYIRWSSKKQEEGDSERRQRELIKQSKEWLKGLDYELDESMNLIDKGESAFTGTPPSLGRFLKAVKTGEVKRGSMLIAESFDRLNRNNPEDAMRQFLDLKADGILIGILNNWKVYEPGQDWTELILPLVESGRSHEESKRKRDFQKARWDKVRQDALKGIRSKHKCPYWLRWDEEKQEYVKIPDAVEAVRRVYDLKIEKKWGAVQITHEMNRLKIWMPPVTKGNKNGGWNTSYVNRCLRNETPIGTFAPHLRIKEKQPDGKVAIRREPACEPILNYYPSIFEPSEEWKFYEVQRMMNLTGNLPGKGGGGALDKKQSNIFRGIIRCSVCNGSVIYVDKSSKKSKSPKAYLVCTKANYKHECTARRFNYHEFEKLFFEYMDELTVKDVLPAPKEQEDRIQELERQIQSGKKYLQTLATKAENLLQAFGESKDSRNRAMIDKRLTDVNNEIDRVSKTIKQSSEELESAQGEADKVQAILKTSNTLYRSLCDMPEGPKKVEFRKRLRTEIQELIDYIVIYPLQQPYKPEQEIDYDDADGRQRGPEHESPGSGMVRTMRSKSIDHFRIFFRAGQTKTNSLSATVWLNTLGDYR